MCVSKYSPVYSSHFHQWISALVGCFFTLLIRIIKKWKKWKLDEKDVHLFLYLNLQQTIYVNANDPMRIERSWFLFQIKTKAIVFRFFCLLDLSFYTFWEDKELKNSLASTLFSAFYSGFSIYFSSLDSNNLWFILFAFSTHTQLDQQYQI